MLEEMKALHAIATAALLALTGCQALEETWKNVDKEALLRGALKAASLYVSIEHPELAPMVRTASRVFDAPADERPVEVVRAFRDKLLVNPPEELSEGQRVALVALADAVEEAYIYDPELLEELSTIVDQPDVVSGGGQIPFPSK